MPASPRCSITWSARSSRSSPTSRKPPATALSASEQSSRPAGQQATGLKALIGQIVFLDTPGIHKPLHRLNVRMVDAAIDTFSEVDVIAVVDRCAAKRAAAAIASCSTWSQRSKTPRILVLNKVDSDPEAEPAAAARRVREGRLRGAGAGVGEDRRERRSARAGAALAPAGRRSDLSGRLPDRSARALLRRRAGPRAGPAANARRTAVLDRRGRRQVRRGRTPRA